MQTTEAQESLLNNPKMEEAFRSRFEGGMLLLKSKLHEYSTRELTRAIMATLLLGVGTIEEEDLVKRLPKNEKEKDLTTLMVRLLEMNIVLRGYEQKRHQETNKEKLYDEENASDSSTNVSSTQEG